MFIEEKNPRSAYSVIWNKQVHVYHKGLELKKNQNNPASC